MRIGEKIKATRVTKNITLLKFSEQLSISVSQLLKWEDGNEVPSNIEIQRIAFEFGIKYDEFISGVDFFSNEKPIEVNTSTNTSTPIQDVKSKSDTSYNSFTKPQEEKSNDNNIPHKIEEIFASPILPRALNDKYISFVWIFRVILTLISSFFGTIALASVLSDFNSAMSIGNIISIILTISFSIFLMYCLKKAKTDLRPMVVYLTISAISIGLRFIFSSLNFFSVIMYIIIIINNILLILYILRQGEYSLMINRLCQIILVISLITVVVSFAEVVVSIFQYHPLTSIIIYKIISGFTLAFASIGDFFLARTLTEEQTNIWKAQQ